VEPVDGAAAALIRGAQHEWIQRFRTHLGAAALVAFAFSQSPGLIAADTKADLVIDPAHFLVRAVQTWDRQQGFGQVGNQSYGYLIPMGPFFLLGHLAALAPWIVQRLWWSVLLTVAYYGTIRLARALDIGTPGTRIAGGFAYALAPRILTILGGISIEAWPGAMLPWVLLPLVAASRGRVSVRRGAALSGVAVLAIGAVNAAATLAVLPVAALYLLLSARRDLRSALIGWWVAAVALAVAWWVVPLVLLDHYGYPFLDYIENAGTTTSTTGVFATLRGAEHWGGYLVVNGSVRWPAGFVLSYGSWTTLWTAAVAAIGLAALCRVGMPQRRWLLTCVVLGLLLISIGHSGQFASPVSSPVRSLLDGPLAAFRNVHKFDPLLRLPIALGLVQSLAWLKVWRPARLDRRVPAVVSGLVVLSLIGAVFPGLREGVTPPAPYRSVPAYWTQAADWLAARSSAGSALLVPSSNFAVYDWGSPEDEPLQALARSDWAVRDAVPLGAPGTYRILDAVDALLAEGRPSPRLTPALARMGIHYLLLRNDLNAGGAGAVAPWIVRAAIAGSPGLSPAATFGPHLFGPGANGAATDSPAIEMFSVDSATPAVSTAPVVGAVTVVGGAESTVDLAGTSLLGGHAELTVGSPGVASAPTSGTQVLTDTDRRRALNFGAGSSSRYSPTLAAGADPRGERPAADIGPVLTAAQQTVSRVDGVGTVTASSSAADPFALLYRGPSYRPEAALDGDLETEWLSSGQGVGQWLQVDFDGAVSVPAIRLSLVDDPAIGPTVTRLRVQTDAGTRTEAVAPGESMQTVKLPPGSTRHLKITVVGVEPGGTAGSSVGIRELNVPGLHPVPALVLPRSSGAANTVVALQRTGGDRGTCLPTTHAYSCQNGLDLVGEEAVPYRRDVVTSGPTTASTTATVRFEGAPTAAVQAAVDAAYGMSVTGSSSAFTDLAARPGAALDGNPSTAWIPATSDVAPTLHVHFDTAVTASAITLTGDLQRAHEIDVSVDGHSAVLRPANGKRQSVALAGRDWTFTVLRSGVAGVADQTTRNPVAAPPLRLVGIAFSGTRRAAPEPVVLSCGDGPSLVVDGHRLRLSVHTTVANALDGAEVDTQLCDRAIALAPGSHRIDFADVGGVIVTGATLGSVPAVTTARSVTVQSQADQQARYSVAAGAAVYLQLSQSYNPGWQAIVDGHRLAAVELDGWRQGFVVAESDSPVTVVLDFAPSRWQTVGFAVGGGAIVLLLLFAVLPIRSRRGRATYGPGRIRSRRRATAMTWAAQLTWAAPVASAAVGWLLGGPAGLVIGLAVGTVQRRLRPGLAAGGLLIGALVVAVRPNAFSAAATLGALVSIAALVSALVQPVPVDGDAPTR
jgi:arabinofuranan 3-O-arabinosyltransferase